MEFPEVTVSKWIVWFGRHGAQVYVREVTEDRVICQGVWSEVTWDLPRDEFHRNFSRDRPDMKSLTKSQG